MDCSGPDPHRPDLPDLQPMKTFILLFLLVVLDRTCPAVSQSNDLTEPTCLDWGESSTGSVSVLEGEAGWLSCPLFSHPSVYNYSSTQSAGHNLFWYRLLEGQDLEQPITYSSRLSRDRERLWLQPATAEDMGQYICMLRNKSSCSRISMRLKVLRRDEMVRYRVCEPPVAVAPIQHLIPLQEGKTMDCPDVQEAASMSNSTPTVTWYHSDPETLCPTRPLWHWTTEQRGLSLQIHVMEIFLQGLYFCVVQYQRRSQTLNFTRSINISAIHSTAVSKLPSILQPIEGKVFTVKTNSEVSLLCRGLIPFVLQNPSKEIWWTVDGKTVSELSNERFSQKNSLLSNDFGDVTEDSILLIRDFQREDLNRELNCSVRNQRGFMTRRVHLKEEASLPSVELGCGLGITLVLMLLLFVVYQVFWLELLLLYRSWFGTDERHLDDKEYDVYISYARNSEEEQFVLSTLRSVLENELGYSVCIFDRDSLPGGNMSESILHAMKKSRRLVFVLSPDLVAEKSLGLLECRLGLYLQRSLGACVVALVFRSVSKLGAAEATQLRQGAACVVTWRRGRSEPRRSRFWLRLQLALPLRPLALGRRLIDSTSSHSDLAGLALQRVQRIQNQNRRGMTNKSRMNRRTSTNQSRGRDSVGREEGPQHSRTCSGCTRFTGQGKDRRVELTMETGVQHVLRDSTQIPHLAHNTIGPAHSSDSALSNNQQGGAKSLIQHHQLIGGRISEEVMSAEEGEGLVVQMSETPPPIKNN